MDTYILKRIRLHHLNIIQGADVEREIERFATEMHKYCMAKKCTCGAPIYDGRDFCSATCAEN